MNESVVMGELRRFALTTQNETELEELERVLVEKRLSRQDLAIILFGLHVKPGIVRSDFGI